jgi:uncharacterized repeat protein (TIGR03803 family)
MKTARLTNAGKALLVPRFSVSNVFVCIVLFGMSIQSIGLHAQTYTDLHDFNCPVDGGRPNYSGIVAQGRDGNLYGTLPVGCGGSLGTVFKITPSGTFTVIYKFTISDGSRPFSGLTLGTDGNFYGTTQQGGTAGYGTLFKITPSGTLTVLHTFGGYDGAQANQPPVLGKVGLYGVTPAEAAYSILPSGAFKWLSKANFTGPSSAPLVLAGNGNLYGTQWTGGSSGYGTVFKLSPDGTLTTIYTFDQTHGASPSGLVVGSDGNLYGTARAGGTATNPAGVVFKLTPNGAITVLHNFDSQSSDGASPLSGLVASSDGNFYGGTQASKGAPHGTLFKITKGGIFSVVHTFHGSEGEYVFSAPMQHTNGIIYGTTNSGGATNNGVFWSLNAGIAPFVSIVGLPTGKPGTTVEILGQGFSSATSVMFGSGAASFNVVSDTYLTAIVPDSGTVGPVTVSTSSGALKSAQTFKVLPVLSTFSPSRGPVGTQVTITGAGLADTSAVTFNGVKAAFTVNLDGTQITATVPSGATSGKLVIKTPGSLITFPDYMPFIVT